MIGLNGSDVLSAMAGFSPILAQAAPAGGGMNDIMVTMVPLIAMFGIMYFLVLRPQQQKLRAHQEMIAAVKAGDTVVTTGGIIGKVVQVVDDSELKIEIADNVRVRLARGMISDVRNKDAAKKAS
jgi:preprotein translocase subunit YajC